MLSLPSASVGDKVAASMSVGLAGTRMRGVITAADMVTVYQRNDSRSDVDALSGVLSVTATKTV